MGFYFTWYIQYIIPRTTTIYEYSVHNVYYTFITIGTASCTMYTVHCTVYNVQCTVYNVQCTLYSVHYTLYIILCTLYSVHYTLYVILCTLYSVRYTLYALYRTNCLPLQSNRSSTCDKVLVNDNTRICLVYG